MSAQPPLQDALNDVVESGQRLLIDRIDLLQLEMQAGLEKAGKMAVLATVAATCSIGALAALSASLGLLLSVVVPGWAAAGIMALLYAGIAGGCFLAVRTQASASAPRSSLTPAEVSQWTHEQ